MRADHVDLQVAQAGAEILEVRGGEVLVGESDHAMAAQRLDDGVGIRFGQVGEVQPFHRPAQRFTRRGYLDRHCSSSNTFPAARTWKRQAR